LREDDRLLRSAHALIRIASHSQETLTTDAEWLLDNFFVVEDVLREVKRDLPAGYYNKLPRLTVGPLAGFPRILALAAGLIAHTDASLSAGQIREPQVLDALRSVMDPDLHRDIVSLGFIRNLVIEGDTVSFDVNLTTPACPVKDRLREQSRQAVLSGVPGVRDVRVTMTAEVRRPQAPDTSALKTVRNIVAVGSGKGGVGKSTVAANLAAGLARTGAAVGLLDADVYGPSIPHLLGISERPGIEDGKIQPIAVAGLKVISMGLVVPPGDAVVWRGPMLHRALTQFLQDTAWGELDYLIIDMPPGTGDVALSLSQLLPLTGAVIVCTPQDVALLDAVKAIDMFRKVSIPLLGMVENMSYFLCPDNGKRYDIFGSGGAKRRAEELGIPFLGEVPIQIQIRALGDAGQTPDNFRDAETAPYLEAIVGRLVRNLARDHRREPPLPSLTIL
jgi:ATP-binding protein involved in chromosome partitioning